MPERAGSQLCHGAEPVFVRQSHGTASGFPEFMREGRDLVVSECDDAMSGAASGRRNCLTVLMSFERVLNLLP